MTYIFVGGSQRSGTSLMLRILSDDPDSNPLFGECAYLRSLIQAYTAGQNTFDELKHLFDSQEQFKAFHTELLERFFAHVATRFAPVRHLVFKEPHLTIYFPELFELLGAQSRFVVMMRDPRDIVASMLEVGQRLAAQGNSHLFNQGSLPELIHHLKLFYVKIFAASNQNPTLRQHLLVVRYENLVSQPETELNKIRRFTGLALPDAGQQVPGQSNIKTESSDRQRPWRTELSGQAISTSKINSFQERLTSQQIQQIEFHCQDIMKIFGYRPSS